MQEEKDKCLHSSWDKYFDTAIIQRFEEIREEFELVKVQPEWEAGHL